MKINWAPNPLRTTIDLDEQDYEVILSSIQKEKYEQLLCDIDLQLEGRIRENEPALTMAKLHSKISEWETIANMETDHEEVQKVSAYLQTHHMGDCTCVAAGCVKCWAESLLHVNTIQGLWKHPASKVWAAFGKDNERTIDEAIEVLSKIPTYERPKTWPALLEYDKYVLGWEADRKYALEWLKKYKEKHGF